VRGGERSFPIGARAPPSKGLRQRENGVEVLDGLWEETAAGGQEQGASADEDDPSYGRQRRIGRCLRYALRDDYRMVLFNAQDRRSGCHETLIRETTDAAAVEAAAHGADVIVIMAGVSDVALSGKAPADQYSRDVNASSARCRSARVIYASTHQCVLSRGRAP